MSGRPGAVHRDPVVRVSVIAGLLMALAMTAATFPPATPRIPSTAQALAQARLACAPLPNGTGAATITATALPTPPDVPAPPAGRLAVSALGAATAAAQSSTPTVPLRVAAPRGAPAVITGTGSGAPGLTAVQTSAPTAGDVAGLAEQACVVPGTDFWFAGGGAGVGRRSTVALTNPDAERAVVDVTVIGPNGTAQVPAGTGIPVDPGGTAAIRLDKLAPGVAAAAVHIEARSGRVAAAIFDVQVNGPRPQGVEWVPVTAAPDRTAVIPGVAAVTGGTWDLLLAAPGERAATASVQVLGPDGAFVPVGLDAVTVPAGGLVSVSLTDALAGVDGAVLVTADEPVLAGARLTTPGPEFAYAAASGPLTGPAVAPGGGDVQTRLVLAATGDADGVVDVSVTPQSGAPTTQRITVAAGTSLGVSPPGLGGPALITVTPVSGTVRAATLISKRVGAATGVSVLTLAAAPRTVVVPGTGVDPGLGASGH